MGETMKSPSDDDGPPERGEFEAAVRREFDTLRPETATRGKEDRIQAILSAHDCAVANVAREAIDAYARQVRPGLP